MTADLIKNANAMTTNDVFGRMVGEEFLLRFLLAPGVEPLTLGV